MSRELLISSIIGCVIAIGLVLWIWYNLRMRAYYTEEEVVTNSPISYEAENLGIEVAATFGRDAKSLQMSYSYFNAGYMIAFAVNDYLIRFYIYKRKILLTIEDFSTNQTFRKEIPYKDCIDYAAIGDILREALSEQLCALVDGETIEEILDKAETAADNEAISTTDLVSALVELTKTEVAKGNIVLATVIFTLLMRDYEKELTELLTDDELPEDTEDAAKTDDKEEE